MPSSRLKAKPVLAPEYCKGCGRCVDACAHHCIEPGHEINPATGLIPVVLHLEACTGCALCFDACPEPYGLRPEAEADASAPRAAPPPRRYPTSASLVPSPGRSS